MADNHEKTKTPSQKEITRQKRQWAEAIAERRTFKPKQGWLLNPEDEQEQYKEAKLAHDGKLDSEKDKNDKMGKGHEKKDNTGDEKENTTDDNQKSKEEDNKDNKLSWKERVEAKKAAPQSSTWRPACWFHNNAFCTKGDDCPFFHRPKRKPHELCRKFAQGVCYRGSNCRYAHQVQKTGRQLQETRTERAFDDRIRQESRAAEWEECATRKRLKQSKVILHADGARSHKLRVDGVVHDWVVHMKKRVKVNGKYVWVKPAFTKVRYYDLADSGCSNKKMRIWVPDHRPRLGRVEAPPWPRPQGEPRALANRARSFLWCYWNKGEDLRAQTGKMLTALFRQQH
ncbi:unnamed protein product, partial [Prorocentrum cordatum]